MNEESLDVKALESHIEYYEQRIREKKEELFYLKLSLKIESWIEGVYQ